MRNKENARKLTDIEVTAIAFTEAPANKRRFLLLKNDAEGGDKVMPEEKDIKTQGTVSEEALKKLLSTLESVVGQLKKVLEAEPTKSDDDDPDVNVVIDAETGVEKKGAVFSAANKKLIQSVIDMLTKALKTVGGDEIKDKTKKTDDDDSHDHEAHDDEDEVIKSEIDKLDEQTKTLVTKEKFKGMLDKVRKEMVTNESQS